MQRERFITMASNSDVEVNLGPAPLHSNSRFGSEDLVPANLDNAPHAQQENKSPRYVRNGPAWHGRSAVLRASVKNQH